MNRLMAAGIVLECIQRRAKVTVVSVRCHDVFTEFLSYLEAEPLAEGLVAKVVRANGAERVDMVNGSAVHFARNLRGHEADVVIMLGVLGHNEASMQDAQLSVLARGGEVIRA